MAGSSDAGDRAGSGARIESGLFDRGSEPREFESVRADVQRLLAELIRHAEETEKRPEGMGSPGGSSTSPRSKFIEAITVKVDRQRVNQTILIDGERGAGKTSLMLSLLDGWRDSLMKSYERNAQGEASTPVIPLGIIDLQPLPKEMNLAMVLVSRLRKVMTEVLSRSPSESPGPTRGLFRALAATDSHALDTAWVELSASIAAWSGHLNERRASMDADAFVDELTVETRSGIGLDRSLRRFVSLLAEAVRQVLGTTRLPMFVLPIDDADMNPQKGPELIHLLRTFYHPRLVFLLTGNTRLFHQTLTYQYAREIDGTDITAQNPSERNRLAQESRRLALQIYNRAIPETHRCRISPPSHTSRLDLALGESRRALRNKLSETRLTGAFSGKSLGWLIEPTWGVGSQKISRFSELLPAQLRALVDLIGFTSSPNTNPSAIEVAKKLFDDAVSLADTGDGTRRRLESVLSTSPDGSLVFDASRLSLRGALIRHSAPFLGDGSKTWVHTPWRVEGHLLESNRPGNSKTSLDNRVVELLRLLIDLSGSLQSPGAPRLLNAQRLFSDRASALLRTTVDDIASLGALNWPMPQWLTSLDYELAAANLELLAGGGLGGRVSSLTRCYFDTLLTLGLDALDRLAPKETSWTEIAQLSQNWQARTADSRPQSSTRFGSFNDWLIRALLVFAPEFGLPPEDALEGLEVFETLFNKKEDGTLDRVHRVRVETIRSGLLHRAQLSTEERQRRATETLEKLNKQFPDHPFTRISNGLPARAPAKSTLSYPYLDRDFEESVDLFVGRGPPTLMGYLRGPFSQQWFNDKSLRALDDFLGAIRIQQWSRAALRDQLLKGRPVFKEGTSLGVRLPAPFVESLDSQGMVQLRPSALQSRSQLPLASALDLLLANLVADSGVQPIVRFTANWRLPGWRLIGVEQDQEAELLPSLPALPFEAPYDRELAAKSWNSRLDSPRLGRPGISAFLYLITVVFEERIEATPLSTARTEFHLSRLLRDRFSKPVVPTPSARRRLYYDWLRTIPLFTAPEFGMKPGLATVLLNMVETSELGRLSPSMIHRLRSNLLTVANPDEVLARLDAAHADHPFVAWSRSRP